MSRLSWPPIGGAAAAAIVDALGAHERAVLAALETSRKAHLDAELSLIRELEASQAKLRDQMQWIFAGGGE